MRMASAGLQGQLTSSMSAIAGPTASRGGGHRGEVGLVELHAAESLRDRRRGGPGHVGGPVEPRQARVRGDPRLREPAQELVHGHAAQLPRQVPQGELDAADREHAETRGGRRGACAGGAGPRAARGRSGGSPTRSGAERLADDGADRRRRAEREGLAPAHEPLVRRDADEHLLSEPRRPRRRADRVAFQGIPSGTASTVAIFTEELRGPGGRAAARYAQGARPRTRVRLAALAQEVPDLREEPLRRATAPPAPGAAPPASCGSPP